MMAAPLEIRTQRPPMPASKRKFDAARFPYRPLALAPRAGRARPRLPLAAVGVRQGMQNTYRFPASTPAILLTDDYNPIDFYDLWLKERVRRAILETTDGDILLG